MHKAEDTDLSNLGTCTCRGDQVEFLPAQPSCSRSVGSDTAHEKVSSCLSVSAFQISKKELKKSNMSSVSMPGDGHIGESAG